MKLCALVEKFRKFSKNKVNKKAKIKAKQSSRAIILGVYESIISRIEKKAEKGEFEISFYYSPYDIELIKAYRLFRYKFRDFTCSERVSEYNNGFIPQGDEKKYPTQFKITIKWD